MKTPDHLYKYRAVTNVQSLEDDYALDGLFACKAVFSSRKNFNDLFDSKIGLNKPTARALEQLKNTCTKEERKIIERSVSAGSVTEVGKKYSRDFSRQFDNLIDSYLFYCVSGISSSNLMWSHYADSHRGFCIEFKSACLDAEKVSYQEEIPTIDLVNAWTLQGAGKIGEKVWSALKVKLSEWAYEDEYRVQLSNSVAANNPKGSEKYVLVSYPAEWVNAVVFGCRMDESIKNYIANNIPFNVELKQAVEGKNKILIQSSPLKTKCT